jgi:hypothetical protein
LGLVDPAEWRLYCRGRLSGKGERPGDVPANPDIAYEDQGWRSWADWLGTGFVATGRRQHRAFLEAREFVHRLQLKSQAEWYAYCRGEMLAKGTRPPDIPAQASRAYHRNGWKNWGDWLGAGFVATRCRVHRPFVAARAFVRRLGLKSRREWREYCMGRMPHLGKKPKDIPRDAHLTYRNAGWVSLSDWLGAPRVRKARQSGRRVTPDQ